VQWQDNAVNAIPWTHNARFDFFLPIRFISFTDTRVIEMAPPTMPGQYG
jgi:hypothetical protein